MSGYKVDYRALLDQARKIFDEADRYEQTAKRLKSAAGKLAGCWEGAASNSFKQEQERMYEWFIKMAGICRDYAMKATTAAIKYLEAEQRALAAIKKH